MSRGSKYSDQQRKEAVREYAACGSLAKVSESIGVSRRTLSGWRSSPWWDELTKELCHDGQVVKPNHMTHTRGPLVETGSGYSDSQRREACLLYSIEGVMTRVSRALNIPQQTLSEWKNHSDWWPELTAEVRSEKEDHIAAQLTKIVELASAETIDRLENGDVYVHQGEITRAPIKAKDTGHKH